MLFICTVCIYYPAWRSAFSHICLSLCLSVLEKGKRLELSAPKSVAPLHALTLRQKVKGQILTLRLDHIFLHICFCTYLH